MVSSPTAVNRFEPSREAITRAPRKNSRKIVSVTKTERVRQTRAYISRKPKANPTTPARSPIPAGHAKLRFNESNEVLRQASNGPTPVRNRRNRAMGMFTLLKNGGPTLILLCVTHSDRTGNKVPQRTAKHAARRTRLLNRKLDSRDTRESSWLSLRR